MDELVAVRFSGDTPTIGANVFNLMTCTVYDPANNETWDGVADENYGGTRSLRSLS